MWMQTPLPAHSSLQSARRGEQGGRRQVQVNVTQPGGEGPRAAGVQGMEFGTSGQRGHHWEGSFKRHICFIRLFDDTQREQEFPPVGLLPKCL